MLKKERKKMKEVGKKNEMKEVKKESEAGWTKRQKMKEDKKGRK